MLKKILILIYFLKTKYRKFSDRKSLINFQNKQLSRLAKRISQKSFYYRNLTPQNIKTIPVINKEVMLKNFNEINTANLDLESCFDFAEQGENTRNFSQEYQKISIGLSSGTSGKRSLFVSDFKEQAKWAGIILAKGIDQPFWKSLKVALFLRANNNLYTTIASSKHIQFRYFDLMKPLLTLLPGLVSYQPDILVAPPTVLKLLVDKLKAKNISLIPRKIFSVAEVLDDLDRLDIESYFNQKLHQIYQCTEGFIAITCKKGTLHLNEDQMKIEKRWLNKEKTKFSPIITDFNRFTQPVIRYLLDDILTVKKKPCSCGSVLMAIEKIEGRSGDVLYFRSKKSNKLEPVFPDVLSRLVLLADSEVSDYRLIQETEKLLFVYLKSSNQQAKLNFSLKLRKLCILHGFFMPDIRWIESIGKVPIEIKLRRIIRNMPL